MIIGIAGPTASGKTTVSNSLESTYGASRMRYSAILAEIAREKGLDPSDKATLQRLYLEGRKEQGEDFLAKEMLKRLEGVASDLIVIEGNRRLVDIDALRALARERDEELKFLFIDASVDVRLGRYNTRLTETNDTPISHDAFCTIEQTESERELAAIRDIFRAEGCVIDTDTLDAAQTMQQVVKYLGL